jgi:hypothetical protein
MLSFGNAIVGIVCQHTKIYAKSHVRRHFEPYFGPLICIDVKSWLKMAARILQCKFDILPAASLNGLRVGS